MTARAIELRYNPNQPRDNHGRWTDGVPGMGTAIKKAAAEAQKTSTTLYVNNSSLLGLNVSSYKPSSGQFVAVHGNGDVIDGKTGKNLSSPKKAVQQQSSAAKITGSPLSAPSGAPKKPVKKNSAEYWERAREKTLEARDKAKYGGKIWAKMDERAIEQQLMVKHMKATGKTSLTQEDWNANKTQYMTDLAKKPPASDDADSIDLDDPDAGKKKTSFTAKPTTQVPTTSSPSGPNAVNNDWVISNAPPAAVKEFDWAAKTAKEKDVTLFVHYDYGYWETGNAPPVSNITDPYFTVEPNGKIEKIFPKQKSTPAAGFGAAPTTASPTQSSSSQKTETKVQHSEAAQKLKVSSYTLSDALDDAIDKKQTQYVSSKTIGAGTYVDTSPTPPKDDVPYVKVTPSGEYFYSDGASAPAPAASSTGKATGAGRGHAPIALDTAKGPETEFEFDDEATRKFGLDVMNAGSNDRMAYEGTPEGAAAAGRFIPMDFEVARHYKASAGKPPVGSKTAIGHYQGSGYNSINGMLRGKYPEAASTIKEVEAIDKAMAAYATKEPMLLSRGISWGGIPDENLAGQMIQDAAYMSTAIGGSGGNGGSIAMKIFAPAGTHGFPMNGAMGSQSKYPEEREFLLPRGTTILISKDETINGTRMLVGTIVPVPQSEKTKSGKVSRPVTGITDAGYSREGLEYLRTQGRAKWAKRYASRGTTLALSRHVWYNRLVRERQRRVLMGART